MTPDEAADEALNRAEAAAKRIEEWRTNLIRLAEDGFPEFAERSFLGRELRASAAVATMAELEALLREMLVAVSEVVNFESIAVKYLVPSLRSLAMHSVFESLAASGDHDARWTNRQTVTSLEASELAAILPTRQRRTPQPPLDGRTIQSRHIALIWGVLGMSDPVPSASTVASLKKLTQLRNDVAHRSVEIGQVFSEAGRTALHIANYLDDIVLLVLHIGNEWSSYLRARRYDVRSGEGDV